MSLTVDPAHHAPEVADDQASRPGRRLPNGLRWAGRVLAWLIILISLAALTVAVLVPRLGGATPYEILTGSMRPGLPPGTLVVMKAVEEPGQIGVGSVVTYQLRSGVATVVTHRVVEVRQSLSGDVEYVTQGDANDVVDELPVRPEQIRGTLWYAVPHLGRVNQLINGDQRQMLVYLAAAGLGGYALSMYVAALRDRRRRSATPAP